MKYTSFLVRLWELKPAIGDQESALRWHIEHVQSDLSGDFIDPGDALEFMRSCLSADLPGAERISQPGEPAT